jgi:uncharacterized protein (TIRG00374 family)
MRSSWRAALGILLSAALLWWVLRDVPFAKIMGHVRDANVALLLLSGVVATCIFPLRAIRWRPILDPVAPGLPFGVLFRPVTIGIMVSNVVPGRAGELARPYALTRETPRVPFTAAVASVAVDRVFDAAILLTLMFGAMLDPRFAPTATIFDRPVSSFAERGLLAAGIVWAALLLLVFFPAPFLVPARRMAGLVSPRFGDQVHRWLVSFVHGLSVLRSPTRFAAVLWWTLLHWLVNALSYWIAFRAFGLDAPFSAALFIQAVIAIGVALPQAPGFWGGFELLAQASLAVYGVPKELALAWGFSYHFVSFIPITLIGAVYFARLGMHFGDFRGTGPAPDPSADRTPA